MKNKLFTILFSAAFMLLLNIAAYAQPGPPCGGCSPESCASYKTWTLSGPTSPTAGNVYQYTVSAAPVTNFPGTMANTATITITAGTAIKVYVDGAYTPLNAGQSASFSKSIAQCDTNLNITFNLEFIQTGRTCTVALTSVSTNHSIGSPSSVSVTTN